MQKSHLKTVNQLATYTGYHNILLPANCLTGINNASSLTSRNETPECLWHIRDSTFERIYEACVTKISCSWVMSDTFCGTYGSTEHVDRAWLTCCGWQIIVAFFWSSLVLQIYFIQLGKLVIYFFYFYSIQTTSYLSILFLTRLKRKKLMTMRIILHEWFLTNFSL